MQIISKLQSIIYLVERTTPMIMKMTLMIYSAIFLLIICITTRKRVFQTNKSYKDIYLTNNLLLTKR